MEVEVIMDSLQGIVHGKIIELDDESGLPDGQRVALFVQPLESASTSGGRMPPGEGLRKAFGAWSEEADELEEYLAWNRSQRKITRPEMKP
jgi:hypothetical protein